ncbi:MAG: hypothetical protein WC375_05455 [Methanomassiliicoccales archaeon]|jgi:hypothetical protein
MTNEYTGFFDKTTHGRYNLGKDPLWLDVLKSISTSEIKVWIAHACPGVTELYFDDMKWNPDLESPGHFTFVWKTMCGHLWLEAPTRFFIVPAIFHYCKKEFPIQKKDTDYGSFIHLWNEISESIPDAIAKEWILEAYPNAVNITRDDDWAHAMYTWNIPGEPNGYHLHLVDEPDWVAVKMLMYYCRKVLK